MQLMYWCLALGPALLGMTAAAAAEQLGHIVVLKPDLKTEHIDQHIDWVNEMHKGTVSGRDNEDPGQGIEHTFRSDDIGFHGYSGKFSDEALEQIKKHKHVDFVEENRRISLPETEKREEGQGDNAKPGKVDSPSASVSNQNKNIGVGLLSKGQGYNTFLEKARIVDAVIWPENKRRDEADAPAIGAGNDTVQAETVFEFTAPTTEVEDFEGVDANEYFEVPKINEIKDRIAAELKKLKEEKKKQKEEKKKLLSSNDLQSRAEDPKCPGILRKEYKFTEDYNSYLKTLGISGAATISGWGQSASVSGNYLNQAKFSKNSLTYVASLSVERQLTTPGGFELNTARYKAGRFAQDFGDRWIHGFKTGGKMVARVTFTSKDDTKTTDLKTHAEAALSFWGVKGDLSIDVKKGMEEVNKHTNAEVSLFYQGELGIFMGEKQGSPRDIASGSAEAVLGQVKEWADKFESFACKHDYAYGPLLDEYDTVPGFSDLEDSPEVPDYDIAHLYALEILALLVKIEEQKKVLSSATTIDDEKKRAATTGAIKMIKEGKKWVKLAEKDPEQAEEKALELINQLSADFIDKYKKDVANALRVNDAARRAECKVLQQKKVSECINRNIERGDLASIKFCSEEGQEVYDQCRWSGLVLRTKED